MPSQKVHFAELDSSNTGLGNVKSLKTLRKNPKAPKRFKSSYICFFVAKQDEIKQEIGQDASISQISKRSSEMWGKIDPQERRYWDQVALEDKERFEREKRSYTGPWKVPTKRAKKDPSAPKRPMSAFLFYSQDKRDEIKSRLPGIKNTEISRMLGKMWREATDEVKRPYVIHEGKERKKYKDEVEKWKNSQKKFENTLHNKLVDNDERCNTSSNESDDSRPSTSEPPNFGIPASSTSMFEQPPYYSSQPYPYAPYPYPHPFSHPYYGYYDYSMPAYHPPPPNNHFYLPPPHPPRETTPEPEVRRSSSSTSQHLCDIGEQTFESSESPPRSIHPWDVFEEVEKEIGSNGIV